MVKLNEGGDYLSTKDSMTGDMIEFLNEGEWVENTKYKYPDGNPRVDFVCKIMHSAKEKNFRINKTNRDVLILAWGVETADWVGKKAKVEVLDCLVGGERKKSILLHPEGSKMAHSDNAWDD